MAHHTENLPMLCLKKGKKIRPMPRKAHEFRDFRGYLNWSYTPNKKGTRKGAFLFGSNWLPMEASRLRAGRPLRSNVVGTCGSPTNAPSLTAKKGTERGVRNAPITRSKTDETVVSSVFSFCQELLLTHILTQMRKGSERLRKRPRGHSPSHQLPAAGLWWSHGRRYPE